MELNKKDALYTFLGVIGFFLFIYLFILAMVPIRYSIEKWADYWKYEPLSTKETKDE